MKNILKYALIAIVAVIIGVLTSEVCCVLLSGLDNNTARLLGMGCYIITLIVISTGLILTKLNNK